MFSDDEIKESYMRPGDEIISIQEVCLSDKFDKRDLGFKGEALLNPGKNDLDVPFFFPEGLEHPQARFAWTEEDGNITALVSEPGFGTTGQMTFGKDLEAALKNEEVSSSSVQPTNRSQQYDHDLVEVVEPHIVSSTSSSQFGSERSKPLTCKVDKADPRSRYHFVKYIKRHGRTVKLWECSICNREFQHQYTLMRHLPTHTDERNFHCDSCGKSFRQLSTLSQHRAIHSAERPYSCEVCSKTFNRVSTLISHRKTHSDKKPYKCHFCPKGFHQKGNLRNHLFTHTNERPYRCNVCQKGFNQQSNLVCHKNKAHPDDPCPNSQSIPRERKTPRLRSPPKTHVQPDSTITIPPVDHCEVSSSVGPFHPSMDGPSSSTWPQPTNPTQSWTQPPNLFQNWPKPNRNWTQPQHQIQTWIQAPKRPQSNPTPDWNIPNPTEDWSVPRYIDATDVWSMPMTGNGVIVDPIKTYHMGVALATRQTPFALLKPDNGVPVLVKVVDTKLPGGKQMLVPATAEDLRIGGKLVLNNDGKPKPQNQDQETDRAVQIRVPVVATVVPKIQPGGRLHLAVEEPHHAYHAETHGPHGPTIGPPPLDTCTMREMSHPRPQALRRLDPPPLVSCPNLMSNDQSRPGGSKSSSYTLPPPALSPPLDLISMDLFEPMECIPMGPQITAVDNINYPPSSDDSDIFIGEFEISGKATTLTRISNFRAGQSLESIFEDSTGGVAARCDVAPQYVGTITTRRKAKFTTKNLGTPKWAYLLLQEEPIALSDTD